MTRAAPAAALALVISSGCDGGPAAPIRIVAGAAPDDDVTLVPRSSLAEFVELSPEESTLLLTLSSSQRSCDAQGPRAPDEVALSVRLSFPPGIAAAPGSYAMREPGAPGEHVKLVPTASLRGRRVQFPVGGSVELKQLELRERGSVEGLLELEYPGSAETPATRVSGSFSARLCRVARLREP
jgi:hypothetical protein